MLATPFEDMPDPNDYNYCFKCGKKLYVIDADEKEVQGY